MRQVQTRIEIRLLEVTPVYANDAFVNFNPVTRQADDAFDITLRRIVRKPENDNVAAIDLGRPAIVVVINQLVDEDPFAIV